jgi:hypothetical protein
VAEAVNRGAGATGDRTAMLAAALAALAATGIAWRAVHHAAPAQAETI